MSIRPIDIDAIIAAYTSTLESRMSLDRVIGRKASSQHGTYKHLHVLTNPTDNNVLNALVHRDGEKPGVMGEWAVLDIPDVAALHAILTNWLAKRDRRKGAADRRDPNRARRGTLELGGRRTNDHQEAPAIAWAMIGPAYGRRTWDYHGGKHKSFGGRRKGDVR